MVVITDADLELINAGPPAGRAEARLLLVNMVRGFDDLPMPPPIGSEFFNDGELAALLNMSCQDRFNLTRHNEAPRTPADLEN
eukprot:9074030-Heterocapsa_arctica.AAC.1